MRGRPKEKTEDEVEWAEGHNRNDNDQRNEKKKDKYFVILCRRNIQLRDSRLLAEWVII